YMSQAYVLLDCEKGKEVVTIQNLGKIVEVIDADVLVPSHQIICNVMAPTYTEISDIVTKKIRRLSGIKGTTTLNVVSHKMS
ncbi:MAG: AsnC family transcriptional regulator, partial [Thaumarchaeota archaeon]|nr:AsnC family transcriptional regulator [Nitrososphaerota archaeon]NDF27762.1 AsnC family transcriptional regulator [Nitrosopumilaceae archaeon]